MDLHTILSPIPDLCDNSTDDAIFFEDWETGMDGWTVEQSPINAATWDDRDWVVTSTLPKGRAGNGAFGTDPVIWRLCWRFRKWDNML